MHTLTPAALSVPLPLQEDLLLINPDASPPVARIVDWSKYKYELEKGAKERKAKSTVWVAGEGGRASRGCGSALLLYLVRQVLWAGGARLLHGACFNLSGVASSAASLRSVETKEVRLRPTTDSGDIAVKLKSCNKFLSKVRRRALYASWGCTGVCARLQQCDACPRCCRSVEVPGVPLEAPAPHPQHLVPPAALRSIIHLPRLASAAVPSVVQPTCPCVNCPLLPAPTLLQGDRVKLVMKFEGRELQFKEQGKEVLLVRGGRGRAGQGSELSSAWRAAGERIGDPTVYWPGHRGGRYRQFVAGVVVAVRVLPLLALLSAHRSRPVCCCLLRAAGVHLLAGGRGQGGGAAQLQVRNLHHHARARQVGVVGGWSQGGWRLACWYYQHVGKLPAAVAGGRGLIIARRLLEQVKGWAGEGLGYGSGAGAVGACSFPHAGVRSGRHAWTAAGALAPASRVHVAYWGGWR